MKTLRTAARRRPLRTLFGENTSPPPRGRRLLTLRVCVCDGCGRSHHVFHKNAPGRTVHLMARRPSQPGERTVYRFMSPVPAAHKGIWRLVVICAGVNATYVILLHSITLANKNPDIFVSDPCMDSVSCRYYSTTAATGYSFFLLWQSRFFLTTTAWELLPKRELEENLSLPVICNIFDAIATATLTPHSPVYRMSRRRRPRPNSMRCVLLLLAASVSDGACPTLDDVAGLPPTEVPASPPP